MNKWIVFAALVAAMIGMLVFAARIKLIAQMVFAVCLLLVFLLATPLALIPILLCAIIVAGTAVIFLMFYINYIFQKKIIESASVGEEEVEEWE